jgi:hypothetical protein
MREKRINFVSEFTDAPGGRYEHQGPFSGELFRTSILMPALQQYDRVILDLNGAYGFPASFIDESFGGCIEKLGWDVMKQKLQIILDDDPIAQESIDRAFSERRPLQAA